MNVNNNYLKNINIVDKLDSNGFNILWQNHKTNKIFL